MKFLTKWMLIIGLLSLILAGCGTSEEASDKTNGATTSQNENQESQKHEEHSTDEEQSNDKEQGKDKEQSQSNEQSTEEKGTDRVLEQKLKYTVNGEVKENTATLKTSDNFPYSMYVLPEFELTAEEPNKDVLYLSENDHNFMRIELIPDDTDWNLLEESTKAQLQAVNEEVQKIEVPSEDFFKDSIAMEASNNEDVITSYLVKNKELPIKLTIFTKKDLNYNDAFLQMGKTILKEK